MGMMAERHEEFYAAQAATAVGVVVRGIDTLGNARFVRTVIENAQLHRSERRVREFGLADADLSDATLGADIGTEAFEVLTVADLAEGLAAAVPRGFRG
jgi:hypothetical protein